MAILFMVSNNAQGESDNKYFPTFTIVSNNFEKDLEIVKRVFSRLQDMTHDSDNGFRLSERAEMAAGWWFYDIYFTRDFAQKVFQTLIPLNVRNSRNAKLQILDILQEQFKKQGSDAKIKMHGDMPFAAPWWAWLMK
jgi:hypothetical protein